MVGDDGLWSVLEIQFSKVHKWIDRIFPSSTQLRSRAGDDLPLAGFAEFTFEIGVVGKMKKLHRSSSIYVVVFFLFSNM